MPDLSEYLLCPGCQQPLRFLNSRRACCIEPHGSAMLDDGVIRYEPMTEMTSTEIKQRDAHASGYLTHGKFPIQIYRIKRLIERITSGSTVLDLGCGPGPATQLLLHAGHRVVAIDFSLQSLRLNAEYS